MLNFETYYHIYNHANGNDNLFREEKNYAYFLEKYRQHIDPIARTVAWCLMPNHFHLLIRVKSEAEIRSSFLSSTFPKFRTLEKFKEEEKVIDSYFLSKQFSNFFSGYTQAFNKMYERRGSLFLKNFKRREINDNEYLRTLVIYIHLNPVKHCFVNSVTDWSWSSFEHFPNTDLFTFLFDNQENYEAVHRLKQSYFNEYDQLEDELT